MRNEVILVANAAVACGVLGLAWCGRIAEGAQTLLAWSVVDTGLLFVRTDMRADFRDSILLHHLTVVTLVAQFLAHGTPGDEDIVLACLLLEITTPALCVCNLLGARRARAVAWIAGRSWVAWRMLALLPRYDERANLAMAAPYMTALLAFTASWTLRCTPNASLLLFLLPVYVSALRGLRVHAALCALQIPASYLFYNRTSARAKQLDAMLVSGHALYAAGHPRAALVLPPLAAACDEASALANAATVYLALVTRAPTVEVGAALLLMVAYVALAGPRRLTFGHRIVWHTLSAVLTLRHLPPADR